MKERYLYRAKRKDNGEWVEGHYITDEKDPNRAYIGYLFGVDGKVVHDTDIAEVDPSTICQCTGLKDKNGKLIWENDIVRSGRNFKVAWSDRFSGWSLEAKGWAYAHFFGEALEPEDCEVIGNIFDNPELV